MFVYRWVYGALSYPSDNTPVRALDKILESGRLKDVYDRCAYYDEMVCKSSLLKQFLVHPQTSRFCVQKLYTVFLAC